MPPLLEILISGDSIMSRVKELGAAISKNLVTSDLCIMPIMDGGMIFAADLVRETTLPLVILPVKASSYGNSTTSSGRVSLPWGIPKGVAGKDVLLVDDILDTGGTLTHLKDLLIQEGARTVLTCVLLRKESSRHLAADYLGFEIPDEFVVGYGLDYAGLYRNLPYIGALNQDPSDPA
jgi:hypoxanthine phosphoribosyltransferase